MLLSINPLIINLIQSIELSLKSLVLFVHLHAYCRKVEELRMESECRVRVVWI